VKTKGAIEEERSARRSCKLLSVIPALSIAVLLLQTYRMYKFAYFGSDAFNNLCLVQSRSFAQMVGYIVNPVSSYFRPVGMMFYWLYLKLFDLSPAAFRWLMWSLHAANTMLVYFVLKRLTGSRPGAGIGAMLFASQAVFSEIYWNFGAVFELITVFFSLVGTLLWICERRSWLQVLLASLALLLALKAKEMAVSMPLVWFTYDSLLRKDMKPMMLAHSSLPAALSLWYSLSHASAMAGIGANDPYYMRLTVSTLASGCGIYLNMLFRIQCLWQIWAIGSFILLLLLVLLRSWLALFFQLYIFITFLPVIFLVNHRVALFWYLPFLGACGLAAILASVAARVIKARNPQWLAESGLYCLFPLLCSSTFFLHREANRVDRLWYRDVAREDKAFVLGLRALPEPPRGEVIFFDSLPPHLEQNVLQSATQVAFHRTDVQAKLVSEFPPEARYRLRFQDSRLIKVSP
jgi:hypothetical protein